MTDSITLRLSVNSGGLRAAIADAVRKAVSDALADVEQFLTVEDASAERTASIGLTEAGHVDRLTIHDAGGPAFEVFADRVYVNGSSVKTGEIKVTA